MGHPTAVRPARRRHEPAAAAACRARCGRGRRPLPGRPRRPLRRAASASWCARCRGCPALVAELARSVPSRPVDLSLVVDTGLGAVPKALSTVFSRASLLTPRTVETAAPPDVDAMWLERVSEFVPEDVVAVVEPRRPHAEDTGGTTAWLDAVRRVAEHGCAPKLRCGGPRASDVPDSAHVEEFVRVAVETGRGRSPCWGCARSCTPRRARARHPQPAARGRARAGGRGRARRAGEHRRRRRSPRRSRRCRERAVKGGAGAGVALRRRPRPAAHRRSSSALGLLAEPRPAQRGLALRLALSRAADRLPRAPRDVRRAGAAHAARGGRAPSSCRARAARRCSPRCARARSTPGSCRSRTPSRAPCPPCSTGWSTTRRW